VVSSFPGHFPLGWFKAAADKTKRLCDCAILKCAPFVITFFNLNSFRNADGLVTGFSREEAWRLLDEQVTV
jgi:hypothetical protein